MMCSTKWCMARPVAHGRVSGAHTDHSRREEGLCGANLLPGQVHAICGQAEGKGIVYRRRGGYDEVIRQFARGTEGIAMTGKAGLP